MRTEVHSPLKHNIGIYPKPRACLSNAFELAISDFAFTDGLGTESFAVFMQDSCRFS